MKYFKRYFTYRLRSAAFRTVVLSIIAAVSANVITSSLCSTSGYYSGMEVMGIFICIASVVIPILETYKLKKRRTLDLVFALPVTKSQLALAHYLSGLVQFAVISLAIFASSTLAIAARNPVVRMYYGLSYDIVWLIPYFICLLFGGVCLYSVVNFLFSQGNTSVDGMVFTVGCPLAFALACTFVDECVNNFYSLSAKTDCNCLYLSNCFVLFNEPYNYFKYLVENRAGSYGTIQPITVVTVILWVIFGMSSFFGNIHYVKNYRAEKAGGISDSFFGYRVLIPAFSVFMSLMSFGHMTLLFLVMMINAIAVAYFAYRRSFRIKYADIAVMVFVLLLNIIGGVI